MEVGGEDSADSDEEVLHPAVGGAVVFCHHRAEGRGVENGHRSGAEGFLLPPGQQLYKILMLPLLIKQHMITGEQMPVLLHLPAAVEEAGALLLQGLAGGKAALPVMSMGRWRI